MALIAAIVAASGVRGDDEKAELSGDLKAMQGMWVARTEDNEGMRWAFEGKQVKTTVDNREYTSQATLDPKATPHPTIDFKIIEGPDDSVGKTSRGIYKLDGDMLTICVSIPNGETRPTEFKLVEGESYLFELKRAAGTK